MLARAARARWAPTAPHDGATSLDYSGVITMFRQNICVRSCGLGLGATRTGQPVAKRSSKIERPSNDATGWFNTGHTEGVLPLHRRADAAGVRRQELLRLRASGSNGLSFCGGRIAQTFATVAGAPLTC